MTQEKLEKLQEIVSVFDDIVGMTVNGFYYSVSNMYDVNLEEVSDDEVIVEAYNVEKGEDEVIKISEQYKFTKKFLLENALSFFRAEQLERPYLNESNW